jgi:predicted DCC family thiol-disulfide oxidoreductase YuxK
MNAWRIKVLVDGACPLCRREAAIWQRLDRGRGRIALVDISAADFPAAEYGISLAHAMAEIHGILPSGAVARGMEVFRRAYAAVGLGWLLAPTAWPLLRPVFDRAYRWFARNRLRLTGRRWTCSETCASRRQA